MFSGSRCIRVSETSHAGVWEGRFCRIWVKILHFLSIKTGEWDLKILLFNYWNYLLLGLLEVYFLEVGAYIFLKRAATGIWEGSFFWIWVKMPQSFKYKNGGVWPKHFSVYLLKRSCFGLSKNIFFGSRCIRVSETRRHRCLRGSLLLNLSENTTTFKYKSGGVGPNIFIVYLLKWSFLRIGRNIFLTWKNVLDKGRYDGAVLMDLSKAFDTLNHDLLIAKLHVYGFSEESLQLIKKLFNKSLAKDKGQCEF